MDAVVSIIGIGLLAYAGLCAMVFLRQSDQVFKPERRITVTPADVGLTYEEVTLETSDGETLAAWYVPATNDGAPVVLFCHGNAGNLSDRVGTMQVVHELGCSILTFDYRGYGNSSGRPSEEGSYVDADTAWQYLVADCGVAAGRIVIYGRSLGGAVAANLAARVDCAGLIVESTFSTARDMAHIMFPYLPTRWLCRFRYDTVGAMPRVACPVLVAHGPDDGMIPMSQAQAVYDAARDPKQFVVCAGDHNTGGLDADADYRRTLSGFVAMCTPTAEQGEAR